MLDIIHIALLLGACAACYIAGQVSGAAGLVKMLVEHKLLSKEDLEKLHSKLEKEED